eukprot:COSAG02_NODE_37872_length_436_cov_0.952522_1_plen_80_part_01
MDAQVNLTVGSREKRLSFAPVLHVEKTTVGFLLLCVSHNCIEMDAQVNLTVGSREKRLSFAPVLHVEKTTNYEQRNTKTL